jgi:ubiquinone biosynthesis monooxygenase Coq7
MIDQLIVGFDRALKTLSGASFAARPNPGARLEDSPLSEDEKAHARGLMRVNHAGEVCAQALYSGQALGTRNEATQQRLREAAREEEDHLAWTSERIEELGGRTSVLNPLWYAGSFAIGALAGFAGDRWSLGFVAETERQVEEHLTGHMDRLPAGDRRSRAIVEQMRIDEAKHGMVARQAGGVDLPLPIRGLMRLTAKVMTVTAYRA